MKNKLSYVGDTIQVVNFVLWGCAKEWVYWRGQGNRRMMKNVHSDVRAAIAVARSVKTVKPVAWRASWCKAVAHYMNAEVVNA